MLKIRHVQRTHFCRMLKTMGIQGALLLKECMKNIVGAISNYNKTYSP